MSQSLDGPASEYKPQGEGSHPTLAGNVLDPNIGADGAMSHGQGVGGTSEQHVRDEGLEHIKRNIDQPNSGSQGGISSGSGGLGTSSQEHAPLGGETQQQQQGGGIIGTVKQYLGYGGQPAPGQEPLGSRNVDSYDGTSNTASGTSGSGQGLGSSLTGAGTSTSGTSGSGEGLGSSLTGAGTSNSGTSGSGEGLGSSLTGAGTSTSGTSRSGEGLGSSLTGAGTSNSGTSGSGEGLGSSLTGAGTSDSGRTDFGGNTNPSSTSGRDTLGGNTLGDGAGGAPGQKSLNKGLGTDPIAQQEAGRAQPTDSDVTTGGLPTESADPTTSNTATSERGQVADNDDPPVASPMSEHTTKMSDKDTGSKRENKEAIPTAGGEKLGGKHWGESQVVPDNPKPRASEAGISSTEGQPTSETRDNTAANTGGAAPPAGSHHDDQGKEKLVDKIKDKLHLGHKDK